MNKKGFKKVTEDILAEIIRLHEKGVSQKEISRITGVSDSNVSVRINRYYTEKGQPIKKRSANGDKKMLEKIVSMYKNGYLVSQIAKETNLTVNQVTYRLNEYRKTHDLPKRNDGIGRTGDMHLDIKNRVIGMLHNGDSYKMIADKCHLSETTVRRLVRSWEIIDGMHKQQAVQNPAKQEEPVTAELATATNPKVTQVQKAHKTTERKEETDGVKISRFTNDEEIMSFTVSSSGHVNIGTDTCVFSIPCVSGMDRVTVNVLPWRLAELVSDDALYYGSVAGTINIYSGRRAPGKTAGVIRGEFDIFARKAEMFLVEHTNMD